MTVSENGLPREQFAVRLPFDARSARAARSLVGDLLSTVEAPPTLVDDARLVVHELVVNGVRHGRPDEHDEIEVACVVEERAVLIWVHDCGVEGRVAVQPPTTDRPDGRGLAMVHALSSEWSVDRSEGTRVAAWLSR